MAKEEEKKIDRCRYSHISRRENYICVQAGWKDNEVQPTDEAKCEACELFKSRYIEYPITVNSIDCDPIKYEDTWHAKVGALVAVRPCGDEYEKKTYLGFYLGDLPKCSTVSFNEEEGKLKVGTFDNPAMFVPELGKIIWGCGSWWSVIKSEKEFRKITDKDIDNTWYVQLAKAMFGKQDKEGVTLKVGDVFQQSWKGVKEPMAFKVLSIDREKNTIRVNCFGKGQQHEEEWDDLDTTEAAFEVGEYKMVAE